MLMMAGGVWGVGRRGLASSLAMMGDGFPAILKDPPHTVVVPVTRCRIGTEVSSDT
jgi:hypothetical protein